jgi:hypothetical protein
VTLVELALSQLSYAPGGNLNLAAGRCNFRLAKVFIDPCRQAGGVENFKA